MSVFINIASRDDKYGVFKLFFDDEKYDKRKIEMGVNDDGRRSLRKLWIADI